MTRYYITFKPDLSCEVWANSPEEAIEKLKESIKADEFEPHEFEVEEV